MDAAASGRGWMPRCCCRDENGRSGALAGCGPWWPRLSRHGPPVVGGKLLRARRRRPVRNPADRADEQRPGRKPCGRRAACDSLRTDLYQLPCRATGIRVAFGARPPQQSRAHTGQPKRLPVLRARGTPALGAGGRPATALTDPHAAIVACPRQGAARPQQQLPARGAVADADGPRRHPGGSDGPRPPVLDWSRWSTRAGRSPRCSAA